MALACFSDRYAGGNAGATVTVSTTTAYIPASPGVSSEGRYHMLRVPFQLTTPSAAAGPTAGDLWYLGPLPIGYIMTGFFLVVPQMDSSTGLAAELGDSITAGRYIATGTAFGQAAGVFSQYASSLVAASLPHFYSAYGAAASTVRGITASLSASPTYGVDFSNGIVDDLIIQITHAVSGTYTAGTIQGYYELVCAEFPYGTVTSNY